ncbi:MAG: acetoin utilization protein AcuC [Acidobacteria bacterium]|nr:acetoin utilization protein AcuC [Acidobacteriota bacterium]
MPKVVHHPAYGRYDLGPEHPFSPGRIDMVLDLLRELGIALDPVAATPVTIENLLAVHAEDYVRAVEAASAGEAGAEQASFGLGTADNPIVPGMGEAARWLAGGTLHGARMIAAGDAELVLQLGGGFHHARHRLASGFCLYNDLALAIRHLVSQRKRVAYLDVDVHHGDGVQEIFYTDEDVLTLSFHESGEYLFPGTGWPHELGQGMGRGLKLNVPLEPFTEGDSYFSALERVSVPALDFFRPDVLVVQCGADAHHLDPLADLMLTTQDFERIFRFILRLAGEYTGGRALFTLGGGYSMRVTPRVWAILYLVLHGLPIPEALPAAWLERWRDRLGSPSLSTLHDGAEPYPAVPRRGEITRQNAMMVDRLLDAVARYWL